MAAYAAAVSLMHIIDLIKNHPSPPISLDKQQFDSLTEVVTLLQEFLEGYVSPFSNSDEADPLEIRIAEAVYATEDVIESYIVDSIQLATAAAALTTQLDDGGDGDDVMESYIVDNIQLATQNEDEQIRYLNFHEGLQKAIEAMDMIKSEAMATKMEMEMEMVREKAGSKVELNVSSAKIESKIEMVGFDNVRLELLDRLTRGDSNRQVIPIVGMGGIGKTTLTRNVFADQLIKEHFDICMWATISQHHNIEHTLSKVLSQARGHSSGERSVYGLGEDLHKCLWGRRYLVVLDDMWNIEVWDKIRNFFPDCGNGSIVIVTTRMSNLAAHLTSPSDVLCMSFLNEVDSRTLFSKTVFGSEGSVPELREIGEKIVGRCKGLPLSIAVIGGLLARSERTQEYWEYVQKNLNSILNLESEEYCLRVVKLSYNHLPAYLKPCFLYMGVFDEDSDIKVSTVINLWVSEGFLKPINNKSLETVARTYLQELVDRNLVLVDESSSSWTGVRESGSVGNNIKWFKMHDFVRDVCLIEAQKQRFYYVYSKEHDHPSSHHHRRFVIPEHTGGIDGPGIMLDSSRNPRSYICHDRYAQPFPDFRLLRTLLSHSGSYFGIQGYSQKDVFGLVNVRLLAISVERDLRIHSSISRLWSLHTLLVDSETGLKGPVEFWNMHQLKHVEFTDGRLRLQLPPPNNDVVILENLHTLKGMVDFHLNEDVVRRIPNLTAFSVSYEGKMNGEVHCLSYLQCLSKLESFGCYIHKESVEHLQSICFPPSLKQISLGDDILCPQIDWEVVLKKIGGLPLLEELAMHECFFRGGEWETTEGQFPRLKALKLTSCGNLKKWTVLEASHFPLLQKLVLERLEELEEIPSEIGEIATLQLIKVNFCSESAVLSAKKIVDEQEELYGEDELSFCVEALVEDEALESLASTNFQVELW